MYLYYLVDTYVKYILFFIIIIFVATNTNVKITGNFLNKIPKVYVFI